MLPNVTKEEKRKRKKIITYSIEEGSIDQPNHIKTLDKFSKNVIIQIS